MRNQSRARNDLPSLALLAASLFFAVLCGPVSAAEADAAGRSEALAAMAGAATAFLESLDPETRAEASFGFDSDERLDWHFVPRKRKGARLGALNEKQSELARALILTGLSERGHYKVRTIISLENVLREIESAAGDKRANERRNPENYYLTFYGTPGAARWGWRLEGHHISLNFTVIGNVMVASSPAFLGANPHEVREGPRKGTRPLRMEEDIARSLFRFFDEKQTAAAIISNEVPRDIFTAASRKASLDGPPLGLRRADMDERQQYMLGMLLDEYIDNMEPELAAARRERMDAMTPEQWGDVRFAWIGSTEEGRPHYYRIQGAGFLVEYDNIQNDANHSHTVWRDFEGDFGMDLLADHHAAAHTD